MSSPRESWDTSAERADCLFFFLGEGKGYFLGSGEGIQWESLPHSSKGGHFHHNCRDTEWLAWDIKEVCVKARNWPNRPPNSWLQCCASATRPSFLCFCWPFINTLFSVKAEKLTTWQPRIYPSSCLCTIAAFQTESAQKKHFVLPLLSRRAEQQLH